MLQVKNLRVHLSGIYSLEAPRYSRWGHVNSPCPHAPHSTWGPPETDTQTHPTLALPSSG